jgi:hypothetical protein
MLLPAQIERQVDVNSSTAPPNSYQPITGNSSQLLPGQEVNLQLTLPAGVTATNIHWTIPGTSFASYVVAEDGSTATLTQLPSIPTGQNITFYWSDTGTKTVTCTFSVYGQQVSVSTTLTVLAPSVSMTFKTGTVQVVYGHPNVSQWTLECEFLIMILFRIGHCFSRQG